MTFQFESISDFFAMGGYGFYVWLAYGISFLAIAILIWYSKVEPKKTLSQVKKTLQRETKLKAK
ncbi:heme exporter protein CcmD [Otariodibacter oris]|uniref:Heme exporter protein D n=1 Tax=Otariodibacter oris TaxID=1032623 RepID=A0A420XGM5_9PAST|nr:heme exporter protein CcmD [Otariodibacter oris]QGM81114.1 heme exporter protein CcmD [Otariodibacter oris]RKR72666.1 heme exporter protein D [Otariodibacter oris]